MTELEKWKLKQLEAVAAQRDLMKKRILCGSCFWN